MSLAEREDMRLIDADALINKLKRNSIFEKITDSRGMNTIEIIEEQPTAYDVDDVVANLEYLKEKCEEDMRYYEEKSWKDHVSHTNYDLFFMKSDCLEDVIEIVKRGGVE